ncbi:hypothetical protein C4579_03040 [Candidatus Microgenomates bacterium]|nr:MAG: hypothetical protein C4579_03040 [Candidatus Microgenomates bacterium]
MASILVNSISYREIPFENEAELERVTVERAQDIFGSNIVYIDYKRRLGSSNTISGIPDGFLIDFTNINKPQLFYVEYELESHDLYDHIGPQIMKFYASFDTDKRNLLRKLLEIIKNDDALKIKLNTKLTSTAFENMDSLLTHIIYDGKLGIVIVIDEQTEDLNALLKRLSEIPEVIEVQKYQADQGVIFRYIPFREEQEDITIQQKDTLRGEIDTIVSPAKAEGFKHAFIDNDAWWAIRISSSMVPQIKHIAMYEKSPVSQVRWVAEVRPDGIKPYKNTGKYILYLENKRKIGPIKLDEGKLGVAPQSSRYTTYEKLIKAGKISELW